jgi:hypothetical protein
MREYGKPVSFVLRKLAELGVCDFSDVNLDLA